MCFSAEARFGAAAILVPAGVLSVRRAYQADRRYLASAALPVHFGLQQLFEGLVWTGGRLGNTASVEAFAMGDMFFAWLAWPVWVPFSACFLEPYKRRRIFLVFSIVGGFISTM
ncbi:MAG: DUF6629 family protein [Hyphomicrobiaceae bacterium]